MIDPADAVFAIEIDAPRQRVWDAVTRTGEVVPPMFNCVLHSALEPGARMDYTDPAGKRCFLFGEVLEIDPPARLVHTFAFSMYDEPPTRVEWTFDELAPERTRITVAHRGLPAAPKTKRDVSGGWPTILRRFKSLLETGTLSATDRFKLGAMSRMSFLLPKRTLKANTDRRSPALPAESML